MVLHRHILVVQRTAQLQGLANTEAVALGHALGVPYGAGVLLGHFCVADVAAGGEDHRVAVHLVNGAVIVLGLHADHIALLVEDQGFGGQLGHVVVLLVHVLGLGQGVVVGVVFVHVHGPQGPAVHVIEGEHAGQELEVPVVHQPGKGLAGLVDKEADDVFLGVAVGVLHPGVKQLVGVHKGLAAVVLHLVGRVHAERTGGVGAVAADLGRGLHAEHGRAVLGGADVGGHAGGAQTDHDHVIVLQDDLGVALLHGGEPLVGLAAVFVNDLGDDGLGGVGGGGGAGDVVYAQALGLNDAGVEEVFHRGVDGAVFVLIGLGGGAGAEGLDLGDGVVFKGDCQLHLLHHAEGGGFGAVGAVGHGSLLTGLGAAGLGQGLLRREADGAAGDGCAGDAVNVGTLLHHLGDELLVVGAADGGGLTGGVQLHVGDGVFVHRQGDGDLSHALGFAGVGPRRIAAVGKGRGAHKREQHAQAQQHGKCFLHW